MGRLSKKGKTIECMARYIKEHGPSSAHAISHGMAFKNGKLCRACRGWSRSIHEVKGLLRAHPIFKIHPYSTPMIYSLAEPYEKWFPHDPLAAEYIRSSHKVRKEKWL